MVSIVFILGSMATNPPWDAYGDASDDCLNGERRTSSTSHAPKRAEAPYFERAGREIRSGATPPGVGSAKIRAEVHYARRFLDFGAWSFFGQKSSSLTPPLTVGLLETR